MDIGRVGNCLQVVRQEDHSRDKRNVTKQDIECGKKPNKADKVREVQKRQRI